MTTAPEAFLDALAGHGIGLVAGVPCSYLAGPISLLDDRAWPRYVAAANEGTALATAAGAWLAGYPAAVFAQNSGFGNLVNPLTSLVLPYRIAVLVVMSMRGLDQDGDAEPQHATMAGTVEPWLDSLGIPHWRLTPDTDAVAAVGRAMAAVDAGTPAFLLVTRGAIGAPPDGRRAVSGRPVRGLTRAELVEVVRAEAAELPVLATTGYMSRSLFQAGDRPQNLYLQGAMGHVAGVALGAALCRPEHRFIILDGDGALLMHLGTLATIGTHPPENLVHVVFDNATYASTGAQPTPGADLPAIALACGYRSAGRVDDRPALRGRIRAALSDRGPCFIAVDGLADETVGARASGSIALDEVATRFRDRLRAGNNPRVVAAETVLAATTTG
jgi:phosphonopyruvate decarboxylase